MTWYPMTFCFLKGEIYLLSMSLSIRNLFNPYRGMPREVYVIFIARVIQAMGCFVMPLMTLILTDKIGLSGKEAGVYISIAGLIMGPAAMLGGKLADSLGRKKVIMFFDTLGAGFYIMAGLIEPSLSTVYLIIAAGTSMSTSGPAHDSLLADLTTPKNRDGAYALSYMGWNLGFAIGPIVGGLLYNYNLSLVFFGDACMALIARVLIGIYIKETLHKTQEKLEDKTRLLERREQGSIFAVLLRRPTLIYFAVIVFGYHFVYSQWSFMLPMQIAHNFPSNAAQFFAFLASLNGLVVILFTPLLTRAFQEIKSIRRMVYGGVLYALGFGMLGFVYSLPWFFLACFIFTLGEIILAVSTTPFIMNYTPVSHRGRMSAVLPMIFGLGNTLGPVTMGYALQFISIETGWRYLGGFALAAAGLMYGLERYMRLDRGKGSKEQTLGGVIKILNDCSTERVKAKL